MIAAATEYDDGACARCGRDSCVGDCPPAELIDTELEGLIAEETLRLRARREARRRLDAELRPADPPEILTLAQRLARPRPDVAWRLCGWQPADSRVILSGPAKSGKTNVVGNLARALVDGDLWLGIEPVPIAGAVAIVDLEMSGRQLDEWLGAQRIVATDRVYPIPLRGRVSSLDLLDSASRRQWAGWLREREIQYLVLDCLRPLMDSLALDEHRQAGVILTAFDALLAEAKIPEALVIHHMGHGAERSRGDSRLRDWPDVEWRLVREDPDDMASARYLAAYGRDVDQPEQRLAYDEDTRRLTLTGGSRKDSKSETALEEILEVIHGASEPLSGRAIKAALTDSELSRNAIDEALKYGRRQGLLQPESGPRNAILWRSRVPVSRSVP